MEEKAARDIKTIETEFNEALGRSTADCAAMLALLDEAHDVKPYNADKLATALQEKLVAAKDIDNLIALLTKKAEWSKDAPALGQAMPQFFKALSPDRNFHKFVDSVKFGKVKPTESLRRLAVLRSFATGNVYFDKTWGLGEIKGIDFFELRVAIDFDAKPGHSMTIEHAAEALRPVADDHVLAMRHRDPAAFAAMLKDKPEEVIRAALKSFGPSSIGRLQMLFANYGIVDENGWRAFWTKARSGLHKCKDVIVPSKRSDPLTISEDGSAYTYGDAWFAKLAQMRVIPEIFDTIAEYEKAPGKQPRTDAETKILSDRLSFAIKGAFLFPPPMFTRLVLMAQRLGVETSREELAGLLLDDDRFMEAGDRLPVGEAKEMVQFIVDTRPDAIGTLFNRIPHMGYALLKQLMATFWSKGRAVRPDAGNADDAAKPNASAFLPALQDRVRNLLSSPDAPYTLVVWALRENKWEDMRDWKLPSLYELLDHAIAICEDQAAKGEDLQMKNAIKDLYVGDFIKQGKAKKSKKQDDGEKAPGQGSWFAGVFSQLEPLQQEALFMRLQSNSAVAEPRYQRMLVETMIAINPALAAKRVSAFDRTPEQVQVRYTSWRSLKIRNEEFQKLVNVEIPKNTQDISYARSLGDLRENAEYQYAKDQQRILLARREAWSVEIEQMHGTDFSEFKPTCEAVEIATTVTVARADGSSVAYSILGEWDNDDSLHILPSGSKLAKTLIGHKVGEKISIPSAVGEEEITITAIAPLPDAVREWIGKPAENA
ncbi:MAG: GreA/GreB family elongation factor [Kiritimatiellae bacterium]|nr:GreA/GreB family elongation factor [Kiritimatiellia bacterium]